MEETPGGPQASLAAPAGRDRAAPRPAFARWRVGLLALVVIGSFAAGFGLGRRRSPGPAGRGVEGVTRLALNLPAGAPLAAETGLPALALAPRGERLVYVARHGPGTQLYVRDLDQVEAS